MAWTACTAGSQGTAAQHRCTTTDSLATPPSLPASPLLLQACVAAALSVGVLQVLSAAAQNGSALWSSPLSAPMVFSFEANQGSWGLYW